MASDLNKTILIGRLTREPELRYTQTGTSVASFSIANNKTYSISGEKKEVVSFFNCVAWSKLGETIVEYCKKGDRIGIEGRLQQRTWQDKDGSNHSTVEIIVETIQFLQPKDSSHNTSTPNSTSDQNGAAPETHEALPFDRANPFSDDDIPF